MRGALQREWTARGVYSAGVKYFERHSAAQRRVIRAVEQRLAPAWLAFDPDCRGWVRVVETTASGLLARRTCVKDKTYSTRV